jgi:hypothetical protein
MMHFADHAAPVQLALDQELRVSVQGHKTRNIVLRYS